jgi:Ca-activated chloride channel family protein
MCTLYPASAYGEDGPEDAILILDASGSMWGQIEGKNKITIARNVLDQLLDDLPQTSRLGLMAYGHNRKGDCSDIELLAKVGASRSDIKKVVKDINPKGKTPISAAVKQAALALKYTERKATVILISDGIETCNLDPCALGKELEKDGVDFTAHVVGFDITDAKTKTQLQCLAHSTGGRYLSARNADELSIALGDTVVVKDKIAKPASYEFAATELHGGPTIMSGLTWRLVQAGGGDTVYEAEDQGPITGDLAPGVYDLFVERASDGLTGELTLVEISPGAHIERKIALSLDFPASVSIPDSVSAGKEFPVAWQGPERPYDFISIAEEGSKAGHTLNSGYVHTSNPITLIAPIDAGMYEVRYVLGRPYKILATSLIEVTAVEASVQGAKTAKPGVKTQVTWTGPNTQFDYISVARPDQAAGKYIAYQYTKNGSPVDVLMPTDAGEYEFRYVQHGRTLSGAARDKVIARQAVSVLETSASVDGPKTGKPGTKIAVNWQGPNTQYDYIAVAHPDQADGKYINYDYTKRGNPVTLTLPTEAGQYELRYVFYGKNADGRTVKRVMARQNIDVSAPSASLDVAPTAAPNTKIDVMWTGPDTQYDYISIAKPETAGGKYITYAYTKNGSPAVVKTPKDAGEYEVRYVLYGRDAKGAVRKKILARAPLRVQ